MSPDHEDKVGRFALSVFRYACAVAGSVTSWVRTPERNARVGGHPRSLHLVGLAMDVVPNGNSALRPLEPHERAAFASGFGLRLIVEGDHDHLEWRE